MFLFVVSAVLFAVLLIFIADSAHFIAVLVFLFALYLILIAVYHTYLQAISILIASLYSQNNRSLFSKNRLLFYSLYLF